MSDHYDYGYCDRSDTYHDDVKAAHKKEKPKQPTFEELEEILGNSTSGACDYGNCEHGDTCHVSIGLRRLHIETIAPRRTALRR
jgi:hypothetical protein